MAMKRDQKTLIKGALIGFLVGAILGDLVDPIQRVKEMLNLKKGA